MPRKGWKLNNLREDASNFYQAGFDAALGKIQEEKRKGIFNGVDNFIQRIKENIKKKVGFKFSKIFSWFSKKHTKTGRFGQKRAEEKDDTIRALDDQGNPEEYFDPFQEMQVPREGEQGTLQSDFAARVQQQMDLAAENDFEQDKYDEDERAHYVSQDMKDKIADENVSLDDSDKNKYIDKHNALAKFVPDGAVIEGKPDNFAIEVVVAKPNPYTKLFTKAKSGRKIFETLFAWTHVVKKMSDQEIQKKVLLELPEYKEHVAAQKKIDPEYDPTKDSYIQDMVKKIENAARGTGHSFIRLIPMIGDKEKAVYSFGYGVRANFAMGSATEGEVWNPDGDNLSDGKEEKRRYPISYSNFLRAVAKIRAIKGTPRTYSMDGYNCTSFAVDIANEAGLGLSDEASSEDIATLGSRSQRVDMPIVLQKFLEKENERDNEKKLDARSEKICHLDENPIMKQKYGTQGRDKMIELSEKMFKLLKTFIWNMEPDKAADYCGADKSAKEEDIREMALRYAATEEGLKQAVGTLGFTLPDIASDEPGVIRDKKDIMEDLLVQNPAFTELSSSLNEGKRNILAFRLSRLIMDAINNADMETLDKLGAVRAENEEDTRDNFLNYAVTQKDGLAKVFSLGIQMPKISGTQINLDVYKDRGRREDLKQHLSVNSEFLRLYHVHFGYTQSDAYDKFLDSLIDNLQKEMEETIGPDVDVMVTSLEEARNYIDKSCNADKEFNKKKKIKNISSYLKSVCSDPQKFLETYKELGLDVRKEDDEDEEEED